MSTDPRIGTRVAGYRIDSLIGRGGMGVVYLAEHLHLERKVALKILSPDLAEEEGFRNRFIRESRLAASLEHPNIIPVHDAGEAEGLLYIAMRYVKGQDLRAVLRAEGRLSLDRTIEVMAQVGRALDAAHAEGLVHRDVKPGNIMLAPPRTGDPSEHIYLTDFGLTKRIASRTGLTGTGQFLGTIDYIAPEQIGGKPLDGRADLYALGCVLFECLTGQIPYDRDDDAAVLYAHLMDPPPSVTAGRPEFPLDLDDVVATAMAKSPADRFADCAGLMAALREAVDRPAAPAGWRPRVEGSPSAPPPPRPVVTPSRPAPPPRPKPHGAGTDPLAAAAAMEAAGDTDAARDQYSAAIRSGDPELAPAAANALGLMLHDLGDIPGAKRAYQLAIESGHPDLSLTASVNLGVLLEEEGRVKRAKALYRQVMAAGHHDESPRAAWNLGDLLEEEGDLDGAIEAYRRAAASGHEQEAPKAANDLGLLLEEAGDVEGAAAAYRLAADSGHPDEAPRGCWNLGDLLRQEGDTAGARAAFERAIASGHPEWAAEGARDLAGLA